MIRSQQKQGTALWQTCCDKPGGLHLDKRVCPYVKYFWTEWVPPPTPQLLIVQDEVQVRSASWKQPSHRVPNTIFTRSAKYHRNRDQPPACVSNRGLSCSDFVTVSESINYASNSFKSASMNKQWCKTDDHPSATQLEVELTWSEKELLWVSYPPVRSRLDQTSIYMQI